MKKISNDKPIDLLALSPKERVRLCREIRVILRQKVVKEKTAQGKQCAQVLLQ